MRSELNFGSGLQRSEFANQISALLNKAPDRDGSGRQPKLSRCVNSFLRATTEAPAKASERRQNKVDYSGQPVKAAKK